MTNPSVVQDTQALLERETAMQERLNEILSSYQGKTFYAQFKLVPSGRNIIRVCRGTACHVRGGARILREVEKHLGIKPGESTPDLEYCLETVACIGACALAPTMVVNNETHGQMTTKKAAEVLEQFKGNK